MNALIRMWEPGILQNPVTMSTNILSKVLWKNILQEEVFDEGHYLADIGDMEDTKSDRYEKRPFSLHHTTTSRHHQDILPIRVDKQ